MSNYDKMLAQAQVLFLGYDQGEMIARWDLEHDDDYLYVEYMTEALRIDRHTGAVGYARRPAEGEYRAASFVNEGMALFDLLTRSPVRPVPSGRWTSISTLGGIIGAGHDRTLSHEDTAAQFQGRCDALAAACRRLGGVATGKADVERDFQATLAKCQEIHPEDLKRIGLFTRIAGWLLKVFAPVM